jgi:hypothetical protein
VSLIPQRCFPQRERQDEAHFDRHRHWRGAGGCPTLAGGGAGQLPAAQTDIERHFFEQFRAAYPLPAGTVSYDDGPDVTLTGERKIGIEVTRFYLQSGTVLEGKQRQKPLADAVVAKAQALYRARRGKAIELHISFDTPHTITRRRTRKLAENASSADRAARLKGPSLRQSQKSRLSISMRRNTWTQNGVREACLQWG